MQSIVPIISGKFPTGKKWSVLQLPELLQYLLQLPHNQKMFKNETKIRLRFSGDGRQSSNKCHFVLFTLTMLWPLSSENGNGNYFTADDCISVGIYEGKECREKLEIVFPVLMDQIRELSKTGILVDGKKIDLEFVFCSDWKFLALLLGLKNANSTWFCPWCMCSKEYRQLLNISWKEYLRVWDHNNRCPDCDNPNIDCVDFTHGRDVNVRYSLSLLHHHLVYWIIYMENFEHLKSWNGLYSIL